MNSIKRSIASLIGLGLISIHSLAISDESTSILCANSEQRDRVTNYYARNPGSHVTTVSFKTDMNEAQVASAIPSGQAVSAPGEAFEAVWEAMQEWDEASFIIMKGQNVFEVLSSVGTGSPSKRSSYYNIAYEDPLRGHLRPDLYSAIYAVEQPTNNDAVSRGVLFFDQAGATVFGAFISGASKHISADELAKFRKVWDIVAAKPNVCSPVSDDR
jgi:heme iron utilization protein